MFLKIPNVQWKHAHCNRNLKLRELQRTEIVFQILFSYFGTIYKTGALVAEKIFGDWLNEGIFVT